MQEAIDAGADAFFDEKYGDTVRTVRVDGYSHELCGGTHCRASGQIGSFVITGERSIGSGMRRIEALTGSGADALSAKSRRRAGGRGRGRRRPDPGQLPDRVRALQEELREARRRLRAGATPAAASRRPRSWRPAPRSSRPGLRIVTYAGPFGSIDELKGVAKDVRGVLGPGVIALALDADEPQLFVTVSDDLVDGGLAAGELIRAAMPAIDGRGGGRPEMAQGKGSRREGIGEAPRTIRDLTARRRLPRRASGWPSSAGSGSATGTRPSRPARRSTSGRSSPRRSSSRSATTATARSAASAASARA